MARQATAIRGTRPGWGPRVRSFIRPCTTVAKALEAGLPAHVTLPIHASTPDHRLGICIWEGESVAAVREVVDAVVGAYAENEYSEMEVDGLTAQLRS